MIAGVSVVLVSFNTRQLTLDCLQSLFADLKDKLAQVIVVDNASVDGTPEAIRSAFPSVKLIELPENVGFGAGNNVGFAQCQYDYVLLLNTDTIVHPGAIAAMQRVLDRQPQCAGVGCRLENADGSLQRSCWSFPSPLLAWSEALGLNRLGITRDWHRWSHNSLQGVDFVIGAALMVRKRVIEQVGGFDPRFFLYAEETDWQKRMHEAGWKIVFTPEGTITHFGGSSGASLRDRQLVESCRGTATFIEKHHGILGRELFRAGVVFGTGLRWIGYSLRAIVDARCKPRALLLMKTLMWWLGVGSHQGIRELQKIPANPLAKQ